MNISEKTKFEEIKTEKSSFSFGGILIEISLLAVIVAVGWFLIGYYTKYEFLGTGYQDWIYHAFRVRDIMQYGIASWDHVWSNGINHWRAYQYVEHMLVICIVKLAGFSITHAMLWLSTAIFIAIRVFIYLMLRYLGISRLFSFFVVIVSYASSQQWISLRDFAMHAAFIVVPLYVFLWIATLKNMRYVYTLAAVTGALWSVHPVVGYSASGMLFLLMLANNLKKDFWKLILVILIFLVSSLPFTAQYFLSGYSFSNPIFSAPQFLKDTIISEYFGLSLIYFILLCLSWIILVVRSNESPRWAKLLLFYCTAYLVFIYFGPLGYYPSFINKFQFSRAIPFIALLLPFCFGAFLQAAIPNDKSRIVRTVFLVITVVVASRSIEIASQYSGWPIESVQDPVEIYFSGNDIPKGSVFIDNVSQASYLGKKGLRFVTSYNEHLQPHPYATRFRGFMKTDISYTGVTKHQVSMINDYSTVLGVEYIFIPNSSPLVNGLTENGSENAMFEKVGEVRASSDIYAVLHNRQPIAYAYAFEENKRNDILHFDELPKPTLAATSYTLWDEEVSRIATLIRNGDLKPLSLSFEWPDGLRINTSEAASFKNPGILVMQSYDQNWSVNNRDDVSIEPTNLRFMHMPLSGGANLSEIDLKNNWPWWHWPVQSLGVVMIILTALTAWILGMFRKKSDEYLQ